MINLMVKYLCLLTFSLFLVLSGLWPFSVLADTVVSTGDVIQTQPANILTTVYRNTSGAAKLVNVTLYDATVAGITYAYVSSFTPPTTEVVRLNNNFTGAKVATFKVPNNYYYKVVDDGTGPTILEWTEWLTATTTIVATTTVTSASSTSSIDNPSQDIFNAMIIFFVAMFFPIWFFKRKN